MYTHTHTHKKKRKKEKEIQSLKEECFKTFKHGKKVEARKINKM